MRGNYVDHETYPKKVAMWRTMSNGLCRTDRGCLIMRTGNNADGRKMRKGKKMMSKFYTHFHGNDQCRRDPLLQKHHNTVISTVSRVERRLRKQPKKTWVW